jgi:hypothetical protein
MKSGVNRAIRAHDLGYKKEEREAHKRPSLSPCQHVRTYILLCLISASPDSAQSAQNDQESVDHTKAVARGVTNVKLPSRNVNVSSTLWYPINFC